MIFHNLIQRVVVSLMKAVVEAWIVMELWAIFSPEHAIGMWQSGALILMVRIASGSFIKFEVKQKEKEDETSKH
jgi:hypothetical protein